MTEPMSDEQLELYRAMLSGNKYEHGVPLSSARVLLAEVDRLRDREREQLRETWKWLKRATFAQEIVWAMAKGPQNTGMYLCNYCDEYINGVVSPGKHKPDCPVAKARTFMTQWDKPAE